MSSVDAIDVADDSSSSLPEGRFLSGEDSTAPVATDDTPYLPLTQSNLAEASILRSGNHPGVSSGSHVLAVPSSDRVESENHVGVSSEVHVLTIPVPPVASSRELWHFAIKCRLTRCHDIFSLGELLLFAIQIIPARLSAFIRTFTSCAMPIRGTSLNDTDLPERLRDLLPLPLPAMEKYSRWREYDSSIRHGRSSRGQHQRWQS